MTPLSPSFFPYFSQSSLKPAKKCELQNWVSPKQQVLGIPPHTQTIPVLKNTS